MSDDPTTATPLPDGVPVVPGYGRVGPADPHADPVTHPALRRPHRAELDGPATDPGGAAIPRSPVPGSAEPPTARTTRPGPANTRSRTGELWTGLILSAIVLIFLLVFILQNLDPVTVYFLGFAGSLPIGVALLLAAVGGLLLVAIPGGLRILQLRRAARRSSAR